MLLLIVAICAIPGLIIGKYIFKYFLNPISLYTFIWSTMISLYSLKLIKYDDLNTETWLYIFGAYFCLIIGSLTYFEAFKKEFTYESNNDQILKNFKIVKDNGLVIKYSIIIFSFIDI